MRIRLSGILVAAVTAAILPAAPAAAGSAVPATVAIGPAWTAAPPVPTPDGVAGSVLRDVTMLSQSDVWAVGAWLNAAQHALAVHWNGTGWTNVPMPDPPTERDVYSPTAVDAVAPDDVWAVGSAESHATDPFVPSALVLHYDGLAWGVVPGPPALAESESSLSDVDMLTGDDGWAVGQTAVDGGASQPLILRWQSGQWTQVDAPAIGRASRLTSVFAGSATDVWAVGTQLRANGKQAGLVLHWDGVSWAVLPVPAASSGNEILESVATTTSKDVWAVGSTCGATGLGSCTPLVLLLSHGAWKVVPTFAGPAALTEVIPFSSTDVWVIGHARTPAQPSADYAAHWDGRRFTTDETISAAMPPKSGNGKPASAVALAAAAGDTLSGVLWAVGWVEGLAPAPHAIFRA